MDGRYEVFATHGKGVFSTVLRARDQQGGGEGNGPSEVAIKMIRANETMSKAAQTEKVRHLICYHEHACCSFLEKLLVQSSVVGKESCSIPALEAPISETTRMLPCCLTVLQPLQAQACPPSSEGSVFLLF